MPDASPNDTGSSSKPEQPVIRTLKPGLARLLIILAILSSLGVSAAAVYLVVRSANDPELQEQIQEMEEMQQETTPPDDTEND